MDKTKLKVLIKRAILDGIKYHYEMAELGRGSNFDQFAEDRVKDFEAACDGSTSETGERQLHKQNVTNRIFGAVIHTNDKTFERWLTATDETDARMQILHKYPESACVVRELPAI